MNAPPVARTVEEQLDRLNFAIATGDAGKGLEAIRQLPADHRESFEIMGREADFLGKLGRHEEEIAILGQLIDRFPAIPGLRISMAHAFKTLGRREEAVAAARSALSVRADYGAAWWALADLKNYAFSGEELQAMQQAIAGDLSDTDRLHLHFALGRAHEQRGGAADAFRHYAEGNAITARLASPGAGRHSERVDHAEKVFTPAFFAARSGHGHDSNAPIFIVGLHRSGSTVIEQILASHPMVEATSELPLLDQLMRSVSLDSSLAGGTPMEKLAALDAAQARALGAEYLARAGDYRLTDKPRFIDKMPSNWLHIGLIRLILPNAAIIDARRHPMAAGFSNFRQCYARGAVWTTSLDRIGRYYRDYLRLMRHFDRVAPGAVHRVIHEQLVENFEPEVRRMLDHLGLEFDSACLEFHNSTGPVRSASAEQVRRPINREGFDQWRAFEPWLGPLRDALGPALEDWQK